MAVIVGTSGAETLTGTSLADDISGLAGDDILNGGMETMSSMAVQARISSTAAMARIPQPTPVQARR